MSHDWPIKIPRHGDTQSLLRRKPFFKSEVQSDTLGSPPLLQLLDKLQPDMWFAAHLHVKFAAVYEHSGQSGSSSDATRPDPIDSESSGVITQAAANPDEINIDDDDFDEPPCTGEAGPSTMAAPSAIPTNPDEIAIGDDEDFDDVAEPAGGQIPPLEEAKEALAMDESADLVEQVRKAEGEDAAPGVLGPVTAEGASEQQDGQSQPNGTVSEPRLTKFLALDKPGRGRDFIQVGQKSTARILRLTGSSWTSRPQIASRQTLHA